jgi:hypothetical protein
MQEANVVILQTSMHSDEWLRVSRRLQEFVRRKISKLWPNKWILHHGNALAHDLLRVYKFVAKKSIT